MGTVDLTKDVVNIVLVPIHDQFLVSRSYLICMHMPMPMNTVDKYSILATRKLWM